MAYVNNSFMFCCALLSTFTTNAMGATTPVFAEYIGALFNGVKFTDVPINPNVEVQMILAFAIDYTTTPSVAPTDGKFGIFWDNVNLSPDAVQQFKASNPNVKVSVSLGGDSISGKPAQFTPTSVSSWVANAVSSMSSLIREYHLDGIDIDYEHFVGDDDTFVECIGQLITQLKGQGLISFASIAPFDNPDVQTHYQALWRKYSAVIDYVNFQFYAYDASTTVDQFIGHYNDQVANYPGGNVLVSFTSNPSGGGLRPPGFFNACQQLKDMQSLKGIFVFSADSTKASGAGFQDEMQAQALLAP